jgi:predicted transcriptional regulator YheO
MAYADKLIGVLSTIAEGIGQTFGNSCEVVVHDLRTLDQTIIKIVNGQVTGRKVGGSITDLGLKQLRSGLNQDFFVNYESKSKDGKTLKSTTICLKDDKGNPVAALCINLDISGIMTSIRFLEEMRRTSRSNSEIETFEKDIKSTLREIIKKAMATFGKDANLMNKDGKKKIIELLDRQGVFLIKGAVNIIAKEMNVSRFTIYNYLEETRSSQNMLFIEK